MNTKNKKLKIAIAGLGFGKKVHLEALKESDHLTPVAIYHYEKKQKLMELLLPLLLNQDLS